nr:MAG TPA: hypothetical protein [Caudoviricetes sp.]
MLRLFLLFYPRPSVSGFSRGCPVEAALHHGNMRSDRCYIKINSMPDYV